MKHTFRICTVLLTVLSLLLCMTGCEFLEELRLNQALEALEEEDFDTVEDLVKEYDLEENKDLIRAIKKYLKNLTRDVEDGEMDCDDASDILEDIQDLLDTMDSEDLYEQSNLLFNAISMYEQTPVPTEPIAEPYPTEGPQAVGDMSEFALICDPYAGFSDYYTQACYEGANRFYEKYGVGFSVFECSDSDINSMISTVIQAMEQGYCTILMSNYMFGGVIYQLQDAYPQVNFIGIEVSAEDLTLDYSTYADPAPNTACITFNEQEAGFLAGYAAVAEGYTALGFLGAMELPAITQYAEGFLMGAESAAAEYGVGITYQELYANQFYASTEIEQLAEDLFYSGCEVVFVCGGNLHESAAKVAEECGAYIIGADLDLTSYSSTFLTCACKEYANATFAVLEAIYYGNWDDFGGKETVLSMQDGDFLSLPTDNWNMTRFTLEQYRQLLDRLRRGSY